MDFAKLLSQQSQPAPIEPRELFEALPHKRSGYGYLRDVQGQVLSAWHARRDESDLVVKVNTGAGKTIDGLIVLQSYINEGLGPALYVSPSKYLAEQVAYEAQNLGLATTTDPDNATYLNSEAIAVVSIQKLVNGRSVFSSNRAPRSPAPIGSVVIDDVHAALAETRSQLSIDIPAENELYEQLLNLFQDAIAEQSNTALLDLRDKSFGALARVPFWAWRERISSVLDLLHSKKDLDPLKFSWPAVSPVLEICRAVFSAASVSITPPLPPITHITGFQEAKRRIYLTATLADDNILVSHLGANRNSIAHPITPVNASDIGERLILAPNDIAPGIDSQAVRRGISVFAQAFNVVVIVPSKTAAACWKDLGARVVMGEEVASAVSELRAKHVGLVAMVNRYDGIDLPDSACRVLVLDGLPEAFSPDDRLESVLQSRLLGVDDRQIQRIEQGMGRGVRSNEDHCVVFLIGDRLGQLVGDPRYLARFSPASRAQLKLSRIVAGGVGEDIKEILQVADQVLKRDDNWIQLSKGNLRNIENAAPIVNEYSKPRRQAMDAASMKDFRRAADLLDSAIEKAANDPADKGWLLEQKSVFVDQFDPPEAQRILGKARANNPNVLRPLVMPAYTRKTAVNVQPQAIVDLLGERYSTGTALRLGFQTVVADLAFGPLKHNSFEEAFRNIGLHLGFSAERPEREYNSGPDVLWPIGAGSYWIIEAKSEATTSSISKSDANQLAGSLNWFRERYPKDSVGIPVLVHPSRMLDRDAARPPGMKVMQREHLVAFRSAIEAFASDLAEVGWTDTAKISGLLASHRLRSIDLAQNYLVDAKTVK